MTKLNALDKLEFLEFFRVQATYQEVPSPSFTIIPIGIKNIQEWVHKKNSVWYQMNFHLISFEMN